MLAHAQAVMDRLGVYVSPRRLHRLVRCYVETRTTGQDFAAWFIGYSDPTGEAAVRRVMRDRS